MPEFWLRMGCSGAHPLLWLEAWEIPAQPASGRGTTHFVLSIPFFSITSKKVNSCPWSSAIQKRRLFCCVWSLHKDSSISGLFLCPYKCGIDPDNLKWLIDLPRKGIFYLMGKVNIVSFAEIQKWVVTELLVAGNVCIWLLFMSFSTKYHSLWSLFTVKFCIYKGLKVPNRVLALCKYSTLVWCSSGSVMYP